MDTVTRPPVIISPLPPRHLTPAFLRLLARFAAEQGLPLP